MTPHGKVACEFATALVDGDFARAHGLLAAPLHEEFTPQSLRERFYSMFRSYASGEPKRIHFDDQSDGWSYDPPNETGYDNVGIGYDRMSENNWAYVSIEGDDFLEAITVAVADVGGKHLIRGIEWGRP